MDGNWYTNWQKWKVREIYTETGTGKQTDIGRQAEGHINQKVGYLKFQSQGLRVSLFLAFCLEMEKKNDIDRVTQPKKHNNYYTDGQTDRDLQTDPSKIQTE